MQGFDPAISKTVVKGDSRSHVIAAASVLAKVHLDCHIRNPELGSVQARYQHTSVLLLL